MISVICLAMVAAACSSTNRASKQATDVNVGAKRLGNLEANASTTTVPDAASPGAVTTVKGGTGAKSSRGAAQSTGGNITPPALGKAPSAGYTGPGVTASEIRIGITLVQTGTIFGDVTGVPVDFGDTRAQANAAVEYVNKNGGIAGRKVVPVYYNFDLTRPGLADGQSEQEACSAWTEDNRVFAGINTVLARQALLECMAKRGVPGIHSGMPIDEETLKKYRNYWYAGYGGAALTLDHLAAGQVRAFAQRGLFKDAIVGIEHFDDPAYKRVVEEVFKPELAKVGVKEVYTQAAPRGGLDATSYAAYFNGKHVNVVLFAGEAALYPLFFMRAAETQKYYPKYGLHTDHAMGQLLQPGAPREQLRNATAIGWTPIVDVDNAHDPGPVSARNAICLDVMEKAGQDMSNRGAATTAIGYCDGLFLLADALAKVTRVDVAGLAGGIGGLGTSYVSPGVFGTRFLATKPDGVDAYRDVNFDDGGCACFTYTGPLKRFAL